MRTIKFRGLDKETGKKVFGYYLKSGDDAQIFDGEFFHSVKPESVAQLVGFDKDGKDVYEGDILLSEYDPNNKAKIVFFDKDGKKTHDTSDEERLPVEEITAKFFTKMWSPFKLKD